MKFSTTVLLSLASLAAAGPYERHEARGNAVPQPDAYEAIHQAESRLAVTLDQKDWSALGQSMTQDIIYDNSQFLQQGRRGGVYKGLEQVINGTKQAFEGAQVSHSVTTAKIDLLSSIRAHVITYLIYSHWDPKALDDPSKTYRVWEQCDDIWVLESGLWKLKYSKVTDQAPKFEVPYFGEDDKN
ncbi:hypothetical protein NA57DRAFT_56196 [Rhizodiscina lignyota]|uniref:SnoaL-like domain-containing protein n=1 Tax=Rhizodiscina lignyota TaxID=1504668 RepID=A0A9P4IFV6_9PEZI|nr:hypothetical protein NA57DRAFT_56196 [Rhizodiscina lignyota]